jgi:restriction system protein
MVAKAELPRHGKLLWPILQAVAELGRSASVSEIVDVVVKTEGFSDVQQAVLHGGGPRTELDYRLAWGRTALKAQGLLTNSGRGIWALTDAGRDFLKDPSLNDDQRRGRVDQLYTAYRAGLSETRKETGSSGEMGVSVDAGPASEPDSEMDWKQELLGQLLAMPSEAFERLAQRLLREADFDTVTVTGRSGDGGIDGFGVYRLGLVSFPVFFQCKRYQGTVGSPAVRDFRGAMAGRGDKGLLITTGTFTADAKKEATRDGAPPIDLIDGDRLCDLLKEYQLGVRTVTRTVEDITVDGGFFMDI